MERITDIDAAYNAMHDAVSDVRADFGEEALESGYADVVESVAWDCDDATACELFRRELGYVPQTFAQMRGIPAIDYLEEV